MSSMPETVCPDSRSLLRFDDGSGKQQQFLLALDTLGEAKAKPSMWDCVEIYNDLELTIKCLETLQQSDTLAARVRTLHIEFAYKDFEDIDKLPTPRLSRLLANVLAKTSRLEKLRLPDAGLHGPSVLAALCAQRESSLRELTWSVGLIQDPAECDMLLKNLKLAIGHLTRFCIFDECDAKYPKAYAAALARLVETSANTIEKLVLHSVENLEFLQGATTLPALKGLDVWEEGLTVPCLASVQQNITHLKLSTDKGITFIDAWGTKVDSLARQFPSLTWLYISLEDENDFFAMAPHTEGFVAWLLRAWPKLTTLYLQLSMQDPFKFAKASDAEMERMKAKMVKIAPGLRKLTLIFNDSDPLVWSWGPKGRATATTDDEFFAA
ncbi:hypothetical protein NM688_g4771 [Phlebia brevispora]|uniref:Uncharacterized protein n=1 Tax=Phlebia brevispora TaxID=194682 RepID=A0ACC1T1Q3_9APHY|nr:hypothetical protein NM688_g4771 [Phlebia brevispora]